MDEDAVTEGAESVPEPKPEPAFDSELFLKERNRADPLFEAFLSSQLPLYVAQEEKALDPLLEADCLVDELLSELLDEGNLYRSPVSTTIHSCVLV